jgi:pimeloyl-ACP methyl ester carboxylesterase
MPESLPVVLVPGLNCSARLYAEQIPALWQFGPVTVADHTRDDTMDAIAARILRDGPPRFALAGLSMGGYIAASIVRLAPERVIKLALLDTAAGAETPQQTERRRPHIELAQSGRFSEISDQMVPLHFHKHRASDWARTINRQMAEDTGPEAYLRQQRAIMTRSDARPDLRKIRCPTLVLVGENDVLTPPKISEEIAGLIPGSRLVVVPDCGHLSTLDQPEAVTRALVEWMQGR